MWECVPAWVYIHMSLRICGCMHVYAGMCAHTSECVHGENETGLLPTWRGHLLPLPTLSQALTTPQALGFWLQPSLMVRRTHPPQWCLGCLQTQRPRGPVSPCSTHSSPVGGAEDTTPTSQWRKQMRTSSMTDLRGRGVPVGVAIRTLASLLGPVPYDQ